MAPLGSVGHFHQVSKGEVRDEYITPFSAWEQIQQFIPKDKTIWEPFYAEGSSGTHLRKLGFEVYHEDEDFFKEDHGDIVVSNPPFSKKQEVLKRLKLLNKPFIILAPTFMLPSVYFRKLFGDTGTVQIIIPPARVQFQVVTDGSLVSAGRPSFDCFYYCVGMNLPKDLVFL